MNASKLLAAALTTALTAVTLLASTAAHAECATPTRLEIDSIQFPSWTYDVGGEWTALESDGISHGYCYKQEAGVNADPQVMFNHSNLWYVAIAEDCDDIGFNTWMAAFYGAAASDPTKPEFVRSIRTMRIEVAGDDAYRVALDGAQQDIALNGQTVSEVTQYAWTHVGVVELDVTGDMHTVELHVEDKFGTVAGVAAHVTIDGGACGDLMTGRDDFEFGNVSLEPDLSGIAVEAPHQYHNPPGSLAAAGAEYVWWDADATVLGAADFSVDIDVP